MTAGKRANVLEAAFFKSFREAIHPNRFIARTARKDGIMRMEGYAPCCAAMPRKRCNLFDFHDDKVKRSESRKCVDSGACIYRAASNNNEG